MHNRWWHRPRLHSTLHGHERKVSWLELFYDLIYVATIIQLGNALSANLSGLGFGAFIWFAALFAPIWYTWTGFTFYANRFIVDDAAHRGLVFLQMFAIGGMAVSIGSVFQGHITAFSLCYAAARLVLVALYARSWRQEPQSKEMSGRFARIFAVGASLWLISAFVPTPWAYLVWALAMTVDLSSTFSRQARELVGRFPPDTEHMAERYGLLTIIVLGEGFVKVLSEVSEWLSKRAAGLPTEIGKHATPFSVLAMSALGLVITCCLWWLYFDDVAGSRIKRSRLAAYTWIYSHLPLAIAVTAMGVAVKKMTFFDPFEWHDGEHKYRWLLCGALGLTLLSVAVLDAVTERKQAEVADRFRTNTRFASAFLVLLLAPAGGFMPPLAFVALVAAAGVVQVLFDLSTAPLAIDPHHGHGMDGYTPVGATDGPRAVPPPRFGQAIRIGTPSELRNDLYFYFMDGGWRRLLTFITVMFVFINVVFATLYLLDPASVSNLDGRGFLDAFAFSVQTFATIGYGVMAPQSAYAHVLVTVEAVSGLLMTALSTGLIFAKAARPRSSVLFSDKVVLTRYDGRTCLMFRAGNARGNEIVEASMRVTILRNEVTAEGLRIRRLYDLPLVRSTSPVFTLTWSVMHILDETSPLYGITPENKDQKVFGIIATMTGHDATYAQTVHARHMYANTDIAFNASFVDVVYTNEEGQVVVDYTRFHQVVPQDGPPPPPEPEPEGEGVGFGED